jgi:MOSC domain-containing protein YiiM
VLASVVAVCSNPSHSFSKPEVTRIRLIEGLGVEGDAHAGALVQHSYLVRKDETQPNLRQVHLIHSELLDYLADQGHQVNAGELGENITTKGIDLLALPTGTRLRFGSDAVVEMTGLRNPCIQVDEFQEGLLRLLRTRDPGGAIRRIGGVMGIVTTGGLVAPGDEIGSNAPPEPHVPLIYVSNSHRPALPLHINRTSPAPRNTRR